MKKRNKYLDHTIENLNYCIGALYMVYIFDFQNTKRIIYQAKLEHLIDVAGFIKKTNIGFEDTKTLITMLTLKLQLNLDCDKPNINHKKT